MVQKHDTTINQLAAVELTEDDRQYLLNLESADILNSNPTELEEMTIIIRQIEGLPIFEDSKNRTVVNDLKNIKRRKDAVIDYRDMAGKLKKLPVTIEVKAGEVKQKTKTFKRERSSQTMNSWVIPGVIEQNVLEGIRYLAHHGRGEKIADSTARMTPYGFRIQVAYTVTEVKNICRTQFKKTYSYTQVEEAIQCLRETLLRISFGDIDVNDLILGGASREGEQENQYISFLHPLYSQNLLDPEAYAIVHNNDLVQYSGLGRALMERLKTRFNYAAPGRTYNFRATDALLTHGVEITADKAGSTERAQKNLSNGFRAIKDYLKRFVTDGHIIDYSEKAEKDRFNTRIKTDIIFTVTPSPSFIKKQVQTNANKKLFKELIDK